MSNTARLNHCPKCGAPIPADAPQGLCPACVLRGAATTAETGDTATATAEIPSLPRVAAAFPQLEILELIGRGGMGFVFKARQPHLDRFVALKLLPDKLARDPRFAERFHREGRVLARLHHPNIVNVYDFGTTRDFYYLLMEYVDGVNLRQAMQAGRFSPGAALSIVPRICEALQYAHDQGILHRDIKPENILLDARGQVKIADFGIAKLLGDQGPDVTLTATGASLGTPHYMAPEQIEKPSDIDHRADIYSLGVVFYEMLTGELPIGRFAAPSSKTPVGVNVDEVVFRTLEKDRERRFQSAGEVKTQVEQLDAASGTGPAPAMPAAARPGDARRQLSLWALAGAALVGFSLVIPSVLVANLFLGQARIGPVELWLTLASLALPGVGGTLLGWLGLNEIRENSARSGLPLALFAALAWPLILLGGLTVVMPMFISFRTGNPSVAQTLGRILMLILPAGVITFGFWAIHATSRWAGHQPPAQKRGVLKWIFFGLLMAGIGAVLVTRATRPPPAPPDSVESVERVAAPAAASALDPIRVNFRIAKGQVVTFELNRRDGNDAIPIPSFAGYVVAPDDERARCALTLAPEMSPETSNTNAAWRLGLAAEEGNQVFGILQTFGELMANLPTNNLQTIEPESSFELVLTRPYAGAETEGLEPRPLLTLSVTSHARGAVGGPQSSTTVSLGSTNWTPSLLHAQAASRQPRAQPGEVLAHAWLKSPAGTNATNWIRFTFTNVELSSEDGQQWLAIEYVPDVRGDCEEVFRVDGNGFQAVTRKSGLLVTPQNSPAVRHQRVAWQVPPGVQADAIEQFRAEVAKTLVGKSFVIPEGEQRPLLRFPIGTVGDLSIGIGARSRLPAK